MKEYVKKYGIKLLALVIVVALLAGIAAATGNGKASTVEDTAGAVRSPFQKVAQALVSRVEGFYGFLFRYEMLMQENENLRTQHRPEYHHGRGTCSVCRHSGKGG